MAVRNAKSLKHCWWAEGGRGGGSLIYCKHEALSSLLVWISEHLSPGGKLIFDTPNRKITQIQSPNKLIDLDHKYEYDPIEMKRILERNGFDVINQWGFLDMPQTYKNGIFNPLEVYETESLNQHPETSYCFAFECQKIDIFPENPRSNDRSITELNR